MSSILRPLRLIDPTMLFVSIFTLLSALSASSKPMLSFSVIPRDLSISSMASISSSFELTSDTSPLSISPLSISCSGASKKKLQINRTPTESIIASIRFLLSIDYFFSLGTGSYPSEPPKSFIG